MNKFKSFFIPFLYILLLCYIFIINNNINRYAYSLKQKFEIAVFVKQNEKNIDVVQEKIRNLENIKHISFISKEQVKRKLEYLKSEILLLGTNPFPDTFSVLPKSYDVNKIEELISQIKLINSIDNVEYDKNTLNIINSLKTFAKFSKDTIIISFIAVVIVFLIYMFIIIKNPSKILNLSSDIAFSIVGVILGIICSKLLSLIIYQTNTDFISINQLILVVVSGIIISFAIS